MQSRSWKRVLVGAALVALIVAALFGYVAGSAPAGNRDPSTLDFKADPGPSSITFGKNVAYKGQFSNTSKSNWVHVVFGQSVPYALLTDGSHLNAKLVYSSCEPNPGSPPDTTGTTTYSCPEIASLPANSGLQKVTLVWQSALLPDGKTCASPCQLTTTGSLAIKEGNTGTNDTFQKGPILTSLFDVPDKADAGGYPISKCADPSNPTLTTNLDIGTDNPMATKVCEPTLGTNALNPGLTTTILERSASSGETNGTTQVSVICIADVGLPCPGTPFNFATHGDGTLATFVFVFDMRTYGRLTKMYNLSKPNNLQLVSSDPTADPNCQFSYDNPNKLAFATCHSSTNGPWRGG